MSPSNRHPRLKYTDDVKEMAYLVHYLAKKRAKAHPQTNTQPGTSPNTIGLDVLKALCSVARRFSYADALLRELQTTPQALEKQIDDVLHHQTLSGQPLLADTLFEAAEALCLSTSDNTDQPEPVSAGHVLLTLIQAEDPWLKAVLAKTDISIQTVHSAIQNLEEPAILGVGKRTLNSILFIARETIEMILVVVICLIVIKQGIGELRLIPSESMVPTLQVGDRVVVEKVSHWFRKPHRNDIMVFYPPPPDSVINKDPFSLFMRATGFSSLFHNTAEDPIDKAYIKRLIALPGDEVVVVNHLGVYVNGVLQSEPFVNEIAVDCGAFCSPTTIPEGYYFMLGDNRNQSKDSRYFGLQPSSRMVGRAIYRVFPFHRFSPL